MQMQEKVQTKNEERARRFASTGEKSQRLIDLVHQLGTIPNADDWNTIATELDKEFIGDEASTRCDWDPSRFVRSPDRPPREEPPAPAPTPAELRAAGDFAARPRCPECDGDMFKEAQVVAMYQWVTWDADAKSYEYGDVEYGEVQQTEGLDCVNCGHPLPLDFLKGWV